MLLTLEIFSVVCNLTFIVLLTRRNKYCWLFGFVGSAAGAVLFYLSNYYSESILYGFYALVGIYGWVVWNRPRKDIRIRDLKSWMHLVIVAVGTLLFTALGYGMSQTDADKPYYDAFSSVFGIFATFMELYRYLSGWIYWIVLNLFSVWLYASKGIWIYSVLMLLYVVLSARGYVQWKRESRQDLPQHIV